MNKARKSELIKKWGPVLNSNIGAPITNSEVASVLAVIIESQVKLNPSVIPEPIDNIH